MHVMISIKPRGETKLDRYHEKKTEKKNLIKNKKVFWKSVAWCEQSLYSLLCGFPEKKSDLRSIGGDSVSEISRVFLINTHVLMRRLKVTLGGVRISRVDYFLGRTPA